MEEAFLQALHDHPDDDISWLVLADFLEEHGDPRGELVRLTYLLRQADCDNRIAREDRLRALLAAGVRPCVPELTNSIGMRFVLIPPGSFLMGSPETEEGRFHDLERQRLVTITGPFYLGVFPVTREQWEAVGFTIPPTDFDGIEASELPALPVENVTWEETQEFCQRLAQRQDERHLRRQYRLPTETEWEYACRAGTTTPFWFGTSASSWQANFDGNAPYGKASVGPYRNQPTPSGTFPPSAFGLFDMHGNVWEWCQDWFTQDPSTTGTNRDPRGPETGEERVVRGGSLHSDGWECRAATRGRMLPGLLDDDVGFRVVMTVH